MSHDRVRAQYTCVACTGPKAAGLLLCWPCHRGEKRLNSGKDYDYSPELEAKLDKFEELLGSMRVRHPGHIQSGGGVTQMRPPRGHYNRGAE